MTMTSGRTKATATASLAELASAHTTTSSVSCSRSLMLSRTTLVVVDQHDPQRWGAHGSIVAGPAGRAQAGGDCCVRAHLPTPPL